MTFYTLIYATQEGTFRLLFSEKTRRSNYIKDHEISNYTLGEFTVNN